MHIDLDTSRKEFDVTPLLKGLLGDLESSHGRYVLRGQVIVKCNDCEEVLKVETCASPSVHSILI